MWKNLVVKNIKNSRLNFYLGRLRNKNPINYLQQKQFVSKTKRKQLKIKRCIENLYGKVTINVHKL